MRIALMCPNKPAWLGPARSQLFQSHLEDMGHRVVVIPATGTIPGELNTFDVVFNHAFSLPMKMARAFAKRNPHICVINMNHSSIAYLECTPQIMREFTAAIWAARSLTNSWLVNQDDNGIGAAIGCDRITRLHTPVNNIQARKPRPLPNVARIVIAGRSCSVKNFYNQLVAIKSLGHPSILHFCGKPTPETEYLLKSLDLRAICHGIMPHGKWIQFLKSTADIVMQAGLAESYNYVATEAQMCGVPVISAKSIAARDPRITVDDPNRVDQIVSAITHTIDTYNERQSQAVHFGLKSADEQNSGYRETITAILQSHNETAK